MIYHDHIFTYGVITEVNTVLVAYLLHAKWHKHGKAFRGKCSPYAEFCSAVWQTGVKPFKLLPTKNGKRAEMFSRALHNTLGVSIKLFFCIRRMNDSDKCRNHSLIPCHKVV